MKDGYTETLIRIKKSQQEWLKKHPEISLSALIRRYLDKFIAYYDTLEEELDKQFKH